MVLDHQITSETDTPRERAILVAVQRPDQDEDLTRALLDELSRLLATADGEEVGRVIQKLTMPITATFIGEGKAAEVRALADEHDARLIVFDDELNPRQLSNLSKLLGERFTITDRTALILDIFARHASSREGKLQVELATLQYELPRLRGLWSHLEKEKLGSGVGARFGAGESQLETDRRMARKRISHLKRELEGAERTRAIQRKRRIDGSVFRIGLVGYTNAGKSSLLNRMTDASVLAYDKLFATLDATTRKCVLPSGIPATLTDTVGFIDKLPHELVAAFKSTLAEVTDADLLMHVVDASSDQRQRLMDTVFDVLKQIGAEAQPTIVVWNKCDQLTDREITALCNLVPGSVAVSAQTGWGMNKLLAALDSAAAKSSCYMTVVIPYDHGELITLAHENGSVIEETYEEAGVRINLRLPARLEHRYQAYQVS